MIKGSREKHIAENMSSNKDYMLDDTIFDDCDYDKTMNEIKGDIEFDDSEEGWVSDSVDSIIEDKIYLTDYELAQINLNAEKHKNFEKEKKNN
jgi:hypothetical protein